MNTTILWIIFWTNAVLIVYAIGNEAGHSEACATVHTEWVKGKCMKVTREEIK